MSIVALAAINTLLFRAHRALSSSPSHFSPALALFLSLSLSLTLPLPTFLPSNQQLLTLNPPLGSTCDRTLKIAARGARERIPQDAENPDSNRP